MSVFSHIRMSGIMLSSLLLVYSMAYELDQAQASTAHSQTNATADELIQKKNAMQHFQRGLEFYNRHLYKGAIQEYQKALVSRPNWAKAQQALLFAKRDLKLKLKFESRQSNSLPELVSIAQNYFARGQRLENENNLVEAALAYKSAIKLLSDYPEAKQALKRVQGKVQVLGSTEFRDKRRAEGKNADQLEHQRQHTKLKTEASQLPPKPTPANPADSNISQAIQNHFLNGCQALDNNDYSTAIQEFELILEFAPEHKKAAYKLQIAKTKKAEELKAADQLAKQAAAKGDTLSQIRAVKQMTSIDPESESIKARWEQTKKANQGMVGELYRKGVTLYTQGKYQEALQNWELALELNPEHKKSRESIRKVQEKLLFISEDNP